MEKARHLIVHVDGAARGNPGPAGIGFVIRDEEGNLLLEESSYLGETTNNVAEYQALLRALRAARHFTPAGVTVYTDSELMARQLRGEYRVRQEHLLPLWAEAKGLLALFTHSAVVHVQREENKEADRLANRGIDEAAGGPGKPAGEGEGGGE